jgi:hypothetical protein
MFELSTFQMHKSKYYNTANKPVLMIVTTFSQSAHRIVSSSQLIVGPLSLTYFLD